MAHDGCVMTENHTILVARLQIHLIAYPAMQEGSFESLATPRSKSTSSERESSLALLSTAQQVRCCLPHGSPAMAWCTVRFGSTTKVLAKCTIEYHGISMCDTHAATLAAAHWMQISPTYSRLCQCTSQATRAPAPLCLYRSVGLTDLPQSPWPHPISPFPLPGLTCQ